MPSPSKEARLILAIQALEKDANLSVRGAAKIYKIDPKTLRRRRASQPSRRNIPANSRKLTDLEEQTIIRYIIKLCTRAFHPRLYYVEDMANRLLREHDTPPIGKRWAHNFIKRQPDLQTRFTRKYNYQRAKYKDPKIISKWFTLVHNFKVKYGILNDNIYNFNKTSFIMGIIMAIIVITTFNSRGRAKQAQPSNQE